MRKCDAKLLGMAPTDRGALNCERLAAAARVDPAHDSGADRNQGRTPKPATARREVPQFRFAGERLAVGRELASAANPDPLIAPLNERIALNDRRPTRRNQWDRAAWRDPLVRVARADLPLVF